MNHHNPVIIEAESTLTDRYQTTVPEPVRRALRLGKREKIRYEIREGEVVLKRAEAGSNHEDPLVARFLDFLERDMAERPDRITGLDARLVERARGLVADVDVDLDAPLSPDDD